MAASVIFIYAVLLAVGGIVGYCKACSWPSLVMGVGSGLVMALCAWAMQKGKLPAYVVALSLSVMLSGFFGYRFFLSLHWMPSGVMMISSLFVVLTLIFKR